MDLAALIRVLKALTAVLLGAAFFAPRKWTTRIGLAALLVLLALAWLGES